MKQVINFKAQKEDWEKAKDTAFNKLNKKSNKRRSTRKN